MGQERDSYHRHYDREDRDRHRDRYRRRSRSRDRHDRYDRHHREDDRDRHRRRSKSRDRYDRRRFKFDSPPKHTPRDGPAGIFGGMDTGPVQDAETEASRIYRLIEISNVPPKTEVEVVLDYFNAAMLAIGANFLPGNPAIRGKHSNDSKTTITVEMRTLEETSNALCLSGLDFMGNVLTISIPKSAPENTKDKLPRQTVPKISPNILALGINGLQSADVKPLVSNVRSSLVGGMPETDRLLLLDLSLDLTEEEIKGIVEEFGKLKHIQLFKKANGASAGICLIEFISVDVQIKALEELKKEFNVVLGEDALSKRLIDRDLLRLQMKNKTGYVKTQIPSRCIIIKNLIKTSLLQNDREYQEVIEDIHYECEQLAQVQSVKVPRTPDSEMAYAFVLFESIQGAAMARKSLGGRRFASNVVNVDFYNEEEFLTGNFDNAEPNYELAVKNT